MKFETVVFFIYQKCIFSPGWRLKERKSAHDSTRDGASCAQRRILHFLVFRSAGIFRIACVHQLLQSGFLKIIPELHI